MAKIKHPKMDRHLIAAHQDYEIEYVRNKFKHLGKHITKGLIMLLCEVWNNSRRKVYIELSKMKLKKRNTCL